MITMETLAGINNHLETSPPQTPYSTDKLDIRLSFFLLALMHSNLGWMQWGLSATPALWKQR